MLFVWEIATPTNIATDEVTSAVFLPRAKGRVNGRLLLRYHPHFLTKTSQLSHPSREKVLLSGKPIFSVLTWDHTLRHLWLEFEFDQFSLQKKCRLLRNPSGDLQKVTWLAVTKLGRLNSWRSKKKAFRLTIRFDEEQME